MSDMPVLRIRDFVSGAKATLNGALDPPDVGSVVMVEDDEGHERECFVRARTRIPHDPRGSHWEFDLEVRIKP